MNFCANRGLTCKMYGESSKNRFCTSFQYDLQSAHLHEFSNGFRRQSDGGVLYKVYSQLLAQLISRISWDQLIRLMFFQSDAAEWTGKMNILGFAETCAHRRFIHAAHWMKPKTRRASLACSTSFWFHSHLLNPKNACVSKEETLIAPAEKKTSVLRFREQICQN